MRLAVNPAWYVRTGLDAAENRRREVKRTYGSPWATPHRVPENGSAQNVTARLASVSCNRSFTVETLLANYFLQHKNERAAWVDWHQEKALFRSDRSRIIGGRDVDNEKALVQACGVINAINGPLNSPDRAPAYVSMKLRG